MEMTWPCERFKSDKPLARGRRDYLPRFPDHEATEKQIQTKIKRKRKWAKSRVLQTYPP
jgi:hypothetical protein